jgi:2-polyprenyl-6-methoxyphenol hydroxylase-like FAD-dependent oxidoreductase
VRTREHLRRWGIADALRKASPIPPDYPPTVVFATRMNGYELARFENAFNGCRERNDLYSEEAQWVPQYTLEEVLRAHAASLTGVAVAFGTELRGLEERDEGVFSEVVELASGAARTIRSSYLVGADGARSFVRTAIGARMAGESAGLTNCTVIFRAPELASRQAHGAAIMYWLVNSDVPALVGPMDQDGRWFFMATKLGDGVDVSSVDPAELVRRGTGIADLQVEVIRTDPWIAHSLVASFYSRGRVFLAGDACHLHPPMGGFGMNMGIGDAVDLGWKLAATLQGWGGPGLLGSYEPERRPVHERTIREATINYETVGNQLVRPSIEDAGSAGEAARREVGDIIRAEKVREFSTLGLVLGARYESSPIIVPDGTSPPPEDPVRYVPSACPGCLAPHLWLGDGASLYDRFGAGFTLLVTNRETEETEAIARLAAERAMPFTVLAPNDDRLSALYAAPFALIRPDQHVAWRGGLRGQDAKALLDRVTGWVGVDE